MTDPSRIVTAPPAFDHRESSMLLTCWYVIPGQQVSEGTRIASLETTMMRCDLQANNAGRVSNLLVAPGQRVKPGQELLSIEPD